MPIRDDWFYITELPFPSHGWQHAVAKQFIVGGRVAVDGTVQSAISGYVVLNDGLAATRAGNGVCGWVNEKIPGAAQVVLTDAGLIYNVPSGKRVMVTQYCFAVETTGDNCQFEFGWTDAANGAGTFTGVGPHKHVYTGAANSGITSFDQLITPPERLAYSDGVRCITFRVDANDATCEVTVGWHGWVENE
jgi:hypothetical protein